METIKEIIRISQEVRATNKPLLKIRGAEDVHQVAVKYIGDEDREVLLVLVLNTKNQVIAIHRSHIGTIDSAVVSGREIFKSAILNNGASIVIVHNHPSGIVSPSEADRNLTDTIYKLGEMMQIPLLDHLIVGWQEGFYSFKQQGLI
jgi:DNA repair protein RadC